jgi:hypothetical protein
MGVAPCRRHVRPHHPQRDTSHDRPDEIRPSRLRQAAARAPCGSLLPQTLEDVPVHAVVAHEGGEPVTAPFTCQGIAGMPLGTHTSRSRASRGEQGSTRRRGRTMDILIHLAWRWSLALPLMTVGAACAVRGARRGWHGLRCPIQGGLRLDLASGSCWIPGSWSCRGCPTALLSPFPP